MKSEEDTLGIADECFMCENYWQNNDTGWECDGSDCACIEFYSIWEDREDDF